MDLNIEIHVLKILAKVHSPAHLSLQQIFIEQLYEFPIVFRIVLSELKKIDKNLALLVWLFLEERTQNTYSHRKEIAISSMKKAE